MEKRPFIISPFRHSSKPAAPSRARTLEEKWLEKAHTAVELLEGKKPLPHNFHNWCLIQLRRNRENPENFSETQHLLIVQIRKLLYPAAPREFAKAKDPGVPPLAKTRASGEAGAGPSSPSEKHVPLGGEIPLEKWKLQPNDLPPSLRRKYLRLRARDEVEA